MSSIATVRRAKERGGSGGKVMASKPSSIKSLTPISEQDNPKVFKNPMGKENPRSVSVTKRIPIPAIDKSSAAAAGQQNKDVVRWSTSTLPRGRSSSPSDFARLLSDRMSRVSMSGRGNRTSGVESNEGKSISGCRGLERSSSLKGGVSSKSKGGDVIKKGLIGLGDLKKNGDKISIESGGLDSSVKQLNGVNQALNLRRLGEKGGESCKKGGSGLDLGVKAKVEKFQSNGRAEVDLKEKVVNGSVVPEKFRDTKEKGARGEEIGVRVANKYPSKLHEKLAFLEGKVKRIASDIKKTKEMLDNNNPVASKMILCDIQEKISGVEKSMGNMVGDSGGGVEVTKMIEIGSQQSDSVEMSLNKQFDQSKHSVNGLSPEELEARLFPHRRLLRNRISGASSTNNQNDQPKGMKNSGNLKMEDVLLGPIDENPIEVEFLASLDDDQFKATMRNEHSGLEVCEVEEMDGAENSEGSDSVSTLTGGNLVGDIRLTADETIGDFDDEQENIPQISIQEEIEDSSIGQLNEIGRKISTGGWFVSEGESVLLAHDDGSCTLYDITNSEEKAEYNPPAGVSPNLWGDCWLVRATGADGSSGRYVVAASSGNTLESGFCVWDFYTKDVRAFHVEKEANTSSRTALAPLPNRGAYRRTALSTIMATENHQWWYKPCGPLIVSTATSQKTVSIYDIRDGEQVMTWDVQRPVISMDYSSPLHWRNRGKVVIAETDAIGLWDVNSLTPQALLSVPTSGRKVSALHVNNTDAELGGGVRRRVSSSEVEGNDGVFCTQDTISVLDFRLPSGVGLKISKLGVSVQSIFSRGDSVFLGCTDRKLGVKERVQSVVQQFSLRKGRIASTYELPESNAHLHYSAISQVWGNSDLVMGISGLGLFVFDAAEDQGTPSFPASRVKSQPVRDIIGPDDLYSPTFDYLSSRVLIISKDRPALWRLEESCSGVVAPLNTRFHFLYSTHHIY